MVCATICSPAHTLPYSYVYTPGWGMRHRSFFPAPGQSTVHGALQSMQFYPPFHQSYGNAMALVNTIAYYRGHGSIQWLGTAGTLACNHPPGCHWFGGAFDLTAIKFSGGLRVDCNTAWLSTSSIFMRRRYLGLWAAQRARCTTVLTNRHNTLHHDHMHIDMYGHSVAPPLRTTAITDTMLIQSACNFLLGTNLTINGIWSTQNTEAHYQNLLNFLKFTSAYDPKTNTHDMFLLCYFIAWHNF